MPHTANSSLQEGTLGVHDQGPLRKTSHFICSRTITPHTLHSRCPHGVCRAAGTGDTESLRHAKTLAPKHVAGSLSCLLRGSM